MGVNRAELLISGERGEGPDCSRFKLPGPGAGARDGAVQGAIEFASLAYAAGRNEVAQFRGFAKQIGRTDSTRSSDRSASGAPSTAIASGVSSKASARSEITTFKIGAKARQAAD